MKKQIAILLVVGMVVALAGTASADVISVGKTYAYMTHVSGWAGASHYHDETHNETLGQFGTGQLTNGVVNVNSTATTGNELVCFRDTGSTIPKVDIVFDLGELYSITDIVVGHGNRNGAGGCPPPDKVNISYSTTGATSGFGPETLYALWGPSFTDPTGFHAEKATGATSASARWVKLSFPSAATEKYLLDEITIEGAPVPEPATMSLLALGGIGVLARRRRR